MAKVYVQVYVHHVCIRKEILVKRHKVPAENIHNHAPNTLVLLTWGRAVSTKTKNERFRRISYEDDRGSMQSYNSATEGTRLDTRNML